MAAKASRSVHLSSPTDAADCGVVNNTASVATTNDGSDQSSASVTIQCPDVSVVKTADKSPINAGETAAFTIVVSNAGPGTATGVTLNDPLPAGVAWGEDSNACQIVANTLSCSFGDLAAGADPDGPRLGCHGRGRLRHAAQHGDRRGHERAGRQAGDDRRAPRSSCSARMSRS